MKARDIIPDWPRGTSTSKPWPSYPTVAAIGMYWSPRDRAMLEDEVDSDRRYHEAQACMMDDWHRSRSQSTSVLTHMLFAGELSRPDFPAEKRWGGESPIVTMVRERMEIATRDITNNVMAGRPYYEPLEEHHWPTYGGITRNSEPFYKQASADGGSITLKMIQDVFSPERLECERQQEWDMRRQQAEMLKPYTGAPFEVYAAAYRVAISGFGAPMHPEEYKRMKAIMDGWKPEAKNDAVVNSVPNWTPSDAGNITLEKLQEAFEKVKHLQPNKAFPPYYRAHPATYRNLTAYLCNRPKRPDWWPDWINFSGVQIVPDPKVPLGEFWPPEGWRSDE